jgi:hypothetical protein
MAKFTAALKVDDPTIDGHITLCFCDAKKGGKFSTSPVKGIATVIDAEYWEKPDLTVLLIDCKFAVERHEYYKSIGYTYDYEFIPHISVSKGNLVGEFKAMKGEILSVGNEYARIY